MGVERYLRGAGGVGGEFDGVGEGAEAHEFVAGGEGLQVSLGIGELEAGGDVAFHEGGGGG